MDGSGRVFAYELLCRESGSDSAAKQDRATARLLAEAIQSIGLDTLSSKRPIFITFNRELLINNAAALVPPASLVVCVPHDILVDAAVMTACQQLAAGGYLLAIDQFTTGCRATPLLAMARYLKVNASTAGYAGLSAAAAARRKPDTQLVATHVDTSDLFAQARAAGYTFFQGFFFCAPVSRQSRQLPAQQLAYLNLFAALNRPTLTIPELEDLIKHDVSLTYRVLKSVNSAAFATGNEITSIRQALVLLGMDQVRRWATVWSLAELKAGQSNEAMALALIRARCCELAGSAMGGPDWGAEMFLLGLCSLLDVVLERPMELALADVHLSAEVRNALMGRAGKARSLLNAVIAYERADWARASSIAKSLGIADEVLANAYASALPWAYELSSPH